jgi:competence ComEA-like helix-hairpin-helix protein
MMNRAHLIIIVFAALTVMTPCYADALVNINSATSLELQTLPGIGPGLAQAIIDFRHSSGLFRTIEDVMNVPRIGQATFDKLRKFITVDAVLAHTPEPTAIPEISPDWTPTPTPTPEPSVDEVMALFEAEPSVRDVQRAAVRFAEVDAYQFEEWRRTVKEKGLWPDTVQFTVTHKTDDDKDYTRASTVSLTGGTAYVGPDRETWRYSTDNDYNYQLRLRWSPQDYWFNSDMLRVSTETERQVRFRQRVIEDVTRLYYDRRRLQVEIVLQPGVQSMVEIRRQLQLEELTAAIDGLTGGYFSDALKKNDSE